MAHQTQQAHHGTTTQAKGAATSEPQRSHSEIIEEYAFQLFNESSNRYNSLCDIVGDSMNALVERENQLDIAKETYTDMYDKLMVATDFTAIFGSNLSDSQVASWVQDTLAHRSDGVKLVGEIQDLQRSIRNHRRIISVQQSYLPMLKHQMEFAVASLRSI